MGLSRWLCSQHSPLGAARLAPLCLTKKTIMGKRRLLHSSWRHWLHQHTLPRFNCDFSSNPCTMGLYTRYILPLYKQVIYPVNYVLPFPSVTSTLSELIRGFVKYACNKSTSSFVKQDTVCVCSKEGRKTCKKKKGGGEKMGRGFCLFSVSGISVRNSIVYLRRKLFFVCEVVCREENTFLSDSVLV